MVAWLRVMIKWILINKNRRIVTIAVFLNVVCALIAILALRTPYLMILTGLITVYAVSVLTMERYLALGAACISVLQILVLLLVEPALVGEPLHNVLLLLVLTAGLTLLMMSMITSIQQQEYFSTVQMDRQIVLKTSLNKLLMARGLSNVYATILEAVSELYGRSAIIFARDTAGNIRDVQRMPEGLIIYESAYAAARAAFETGGPTGRFFSEGAFSAFVYIPLKSGQEVLAVVAILFADGERIDGKTQEEIANIMAQAESALERQTLADQQQSFLIESERERIRADFLRAISHDLRSPLTGIMSACSTLLQSGGRINRAVHDNLLSNIHEEAEWLCHMVENLLSVTRVNDNVCALKKSPELVEEVVAEVISRCEKRFPDTYIHAVTPEEPLLVRMDATLILQVLMNLVENAVKYGGGSRRVDLTVSVRGDAAVFVVRDYGAGLSPEMIDSLFMPINRADTELSHGLGIGLSICRSVIRAHGGQITGANNPDKGAVFTFTLPMEETL